MARKPMDRSNHRMIHIWLTEELHKKVRMKAAQLDTSIQNWVVAAVEAALKPSTKAAGRK
jgi:hypothetical protein